MLLSMELIIIYRLSWKPRNPRQLNITGPNNLGISILITRILNSYQIINQSRELLDAITIQALSE